MLERPGVHSLQVDQGSHRTTWTGERPEILGRAILEESATFLFWEETQFCEDKGPNRSTYLSPLHTRARSDGRMTIETVDSSASSAVAPMTCSILPVKPHKLYIRTKHFKDRTEGILSLNLHENQSQTFARLMDRDKRSSKQFHLATGYSRTKFCACDVRQSAFGLANFPHQSQPRESRL